MRAWIGLAGTLENTALAAKLTRRVGWMIPAFVVTLACANSFDTPTFDGAQAFDYLLKQCSFGPRVPGSEGHKQCLRYLTAELQRFGARVSHQRFSHPIAGLGENVPMTNIIASFGIKKTRRVLLCAHWDTRPWADEETDEDKSQQPIIGANDGASGVAVLLEVARNIQLVEPPYGVDIILFDGEDAGLPGHSDSFALGSKFFAQSQGQLYRPEFGVLLDMVGDRDLQIYQELNSLEYAPQLVETIWKKARTLRLSAFIPQPRHQVTDDHLPLLKANIPCIEVIDFDYDYWHTLEDTPDKCSPESLAAVGQLILSLIYEK